jgi:hypothetical protein
MHRKNQGKLHARVPGQLRMVDWPAQNGGSGVGPLRNAVLIEGEPGIGKSALVQLAGVKGAAQGFWGAGDEPGRLPSRTAEVLRAAALLGVDSAVPESRVQIPWLPA